MLGVIVNAVAVVLGGLIGALFSNKISEKYTKAIMTAIALVAVIIGVQYAVGAENILLLVICMVLGTIIGTALKLDERINRAGERMASALAKGQLGRGRFSDAFISSTMLFCIGSMTILGSIRAGVEQDYSILYTKSVMDFVSAIVFASVLGGGTIFSAISVLVIEGGLTLLAALLQGVLTEAVISDMSAVGGVIFIGMSVNLLELRKEPIKLGDMLPAIFMPPLYILAVNWLGSLFS